MEIIRILKAQLPTISPTARSGASKKTTELIPFINSGIDVTNAIKIIPINIFPQPSISAIRSPYLESLEPVITMITVAIRNPKLSTYKLVIINRIVLFILFLSDYSVMRFNNKKYFFNYRNKNIHKMLSSFIHFQNNNKFI